ncbi:unnamed protein product, partial [Rotaria magnacalcarata]
MADEISVLADDQKMTRYKFIRQISKENETIDENRQNRVDTYKRILDECPFGSIERKQLMEYYAKL